jgi:hypothetical protein
VLYTSENYLDIFNKSFEDSLQEKFESLKNKDVFLYRVKTIKSGKMLECEIYPLWKTKSEKTKMKKIAASRETQKNLNDKNAKKNIIRKINTNFTEEDIIINLSYKGPPPDEKQARKDIQNYIRRVREYKKKIGLPELKYIYVIEFEAEGSKKKRIHHHVLLNKMDRDVAEQLWGKGYANSRRLQPDEFGLEGIARYITKDPKGTKRWCASRNLEEPKITVADHKITKRQAEKIAKNENAAPGIFEKLYKGYIFNDIKVKYSEFVSGVYLYTRMRVNDAYVKKKQCKNSSHDST